MTELPVRHGLQTLRAGRQCIFSLAPRAGERVGGEGASPLGRDYEAQNRGDAPSPVPHPTLPRERGRARVGADLSPHGGER